MSEDTLIAEPPTCMPDTTTSSNSSGVVESRVIRRSGTGFRWVEEWGIWVPDATRDVIEEVPLEPLGMGPLQPEKHRCNSLDCIECWNTGVRYADYLKAKRLQEL